MLRSAVELYRKSFSGLSKDIWLLALISFINRAGTMVVPFLTVYLTHEKHFTLEQAGWIMTCFGLGSILGSFAGGKLTDRLGYYPVQLWTLTLSGLVFILLLRMDSIIELGITTFLLSAVADAFRPANLAAVAIYSTPDNRTRSMSLIRLAINVGFAIGPALGGLLAASVGYNWLFWVDGLTCFAAAIMLRILLKPKVSHHDRKTEIVKEAPQASSVYRDYPYLLLISSTLLTAIAFMQMFSTYPVFVKSAFSLNEDGIGALLAFNGLMIGLVEMPFVYTLERRFSGRTLMGAGYLLIGLSYAVFNFFGPHAWVPWLSIFIITIGEMLFLPFTNSLVMSRGTSANRGQYISLYTMTFSVSQIVAPLLGFYLAGHWDFEITWWVIAGLCLVSYSGLRIWGKGIEAAPIKSQPAKPIEAEELAEV